MLEGASIVCFADDWERNTTSKTHIMRLLATKNRVLWVNSIGMRRPTASGRDLRRLFSKLKRTLVGEVEVEPNLFVVNPLVLPLPGVKAAERLNTAVLTRWLGVLCRRHGMTRPILWTFFPYANSLVGRLGERMVIYHCVDEYAEFSGVQREALLQMERDLVRRAQIVFATSEQLCAERRTVNPNTHFIRHGVDVAHFSRALDPATAVPDELRRLPRPVIGFFGQVADWVDLDLVGAVARARPEWSFVLVGRVETTLAPLAKLANVHVLGHRPYGSLPGYCRGFDVGVIPFRINALTLRVNPLKLREYLAAGLPVVSTPLPEVARYDGLVGLADGPDRFLAAIEAALGQRSKEMARRRVEAVRGESWAARVEEISALIMRERGMRENGARACGAGERRR